MNTLMHTLLACFAALALPGMRVLDAGTGPVAQAPGPALTTDSAPLLIRVDPRVELMSLLFRLAGNPEYSQGKVKSYTADVDAHFGAFGGHEVVRLARHLRGTRGVSFDACMSLAVHLKDTSALELLVPLDPWPEGLDKRWTATDVSRFLDEARRFTRDSDFPGFLKQHGALYEITEERLRILMRNEGHLEWFQEFFGARPHATFTLAPALLNGGSCYGARCQEGAGTESLYSILGVWKTDAQGLPEFTRDMLSTVVHEFGHSYANLVVERHEAELRAAGEALFEPLAARMRAQAYGDGRTLLCESLVRACEIRYAIRYDGPAAGVGAIAHHKERGFLWIKELSDLLGEYETHRDKYPTLEAFAPRLVSFFNDCARAFADKQPQGAKPRVVSMVPSNGATDVDSNLPFIQVVFDRPMRDGSWSLVGGGPHCPETTGAASYDASRTTWRVPVKLRPDWSYRFMLNSASFDAFRSESGVPLEPVHVTFTTRKAAP